MASAAKPSMVTLRYRRRIPRTKRNKILKDSRRKNLSKKVEAEIEKVARDQEIDASRSASRFGSRVNRRIAFNAIAEGINALFFHSFACRRAAARGASVRYLLDVGDIALIGGRLRPGTIVKQSKSCALALSMWIARERPRNLRKLMQHSLILRSKTLPNGSCASISTTTRYSASFPRSLKSFAFQYSTTAEYRSRSS